MAFLKGRIDGNLAIVDKRLAGRPFMLGERPTIADISLCAYLYYPAEEFGFDIAGTHKNIGAWLDRIKALPGWKHPYELMPGYPPQLARSARGQAAVDDEFGAGDEAGFVRQQIDAQVGDLGRRCRAGRAECRA